jgi:hypothetical protein
MSVRGFPGMGGIFRWHSRRTITTASFATLGVAGKLFDLGGLDNDVLPPLVQGLFDIFGDIDDCRGWDDLVPAMDEAVKNLVEIEMVAFFFVFLDITTLTFVGNKAFATKRCQWADVRMHGGVDQSGVVAEPLHITWSVHPVDSKSVDNGVFILGVLFSEFHDTTQVVWIAWWLANKIDMV